MYTNQYYDGTKLLSLTDIDGNKPEIYMVTTNRTGGKTTYFARLLIKRFLAYGEKFAILYRFNYELDDCADKFFKDVGSLFFGGMTMESKRKARGIYHELFLDEKSCGYAISLNSADQLKKYAHLFSDVQRMFYDEFQSETDHYCNDEIRKFLSIHTSIARGQGKQTRYVPVYMCANPVSIVNPYYVEMGISARLKSDTKFLRGHGFVLEQGYNESASEALKASGFSKAFASNSYVAYSAESAYLNDNVAFIETPQGNSRYLGTLRYMGTDYALREYPNQGIIYCDRRVDSTYPYRLTVTTEDHQINYVMLNKFDDFVSNMRYYFKKGCFRFKDMQCKEAVISALSF